MERWGWTLQVAGLHAESERRRSEAVGLDAAGRGSSRDGRVKEIWTLWAVGLHMVYTAAGPDWFAERQAERRTARRTRTAERWKKKKKKKKSV